MSKKSLFGIFCFVIISLASLVFALHYLQSKSLHNILGSYTFAETKNNLFRLEKIEITTSNKQKFNLYYQNGIWYFAEVADYFVDDEAMQNFYEMVKNSTLIDVAEETTQNLPHLNIKTYADNGEILDDINFYGNDYSLMSYAKGEKLYKIDYTEMLSENAGDWLPAPLIEINENLIEAVSLNGKYANKKNLAEAEQFSENLQNFFTVLARLDYDGIIEDSLFDEALPEKEIILYLYGGLNFRLKLYYDNENYYVRIVAERELIAKTEVNDIMRYKNMYYRGWTFVLSDEQGKILYEADDFLN